MGKCGSCPKRRPSSVTIVVWKSLDFNGVFHIPDIRKKLINASLLVKNGYKVVFESNKIVITRLGQFVCKGFMLDGLFRLSVICLPLSCSFLSVANVECCDT